MGWFTCFLPTCPPLDLEQPHLLGPHAELTEDGAPLSLSSLQLWDFLHVRNRRAPLWIRDALESGPHTGEGPTTLSRGTLPTAPKGGWRGRASLRRENSLMRTLHGQRPLRGAAPRKTIGAKSCWWRGSQVRGQTKAPCRGDCWSAGAGGSSPSLSCPVGGEAEGGSLGEHTPGRGSIFPEAPPRGGWLSSAPSAHWSKCACSGERHQICPRAVQKVWTRFLSSGLWGTRP